MRSPKGFGKKYFTLASILAHSVEVKLQSVIIKSAHFFKFDFESDDEELDENDPPPDVCLSSLILGLKPCHCNCYYNKKARLSLKIHLFIPRCPYYNTYFAFRRTGVHPPQISL